jgi:nitrite reductase/ring-hydroxylating ferredoxin subunit
MGLLGLSGNLGGRLVYEDGLGVGRHRRATASPERTYVLASSAPGAYVPVAYAHSLTPGETLRVEIDGTVLVVANVGGQFYAFQEFCTHRYGPLSEGRLQAAQVECPWHRSCFDVRTGKVTRGPATVDLRTFPVAVVDGVVKVCVPAEATPAQGHIAAPEENGARRREPSPT